MKPIILEQSGAFVIVKYPYRVGRDLYVVTVSYPAFCCQCEAQFKVKELLNHIHSHDKRKGKAEIWSPKDGKLYIVGAIRPVKGKAK